MAGTLAVRPSAARVRRPLPAVRVRSVPPLEPPTDDERLAAGIDDPVPGMPELPLEFPVRARARVAGLAPVEALRARRAAAQDVAAHDHAAGPAVPAECGVAESGAAQNGAASAVGTARPSSPPTDPTDRGLPPTILPARMAVRRFLSACLEVVGGYRPVTHLRPLCLPEQFPVVAECLRAGAGETLRSLGAARTTPSTPVTGRVAAGAPPRTARHHQAGPGDRLTVLRVQLGEPRCGAAEVAVVLARRERVWAMALRLEVRAERWVCTHLQVL